MKIIFWGTPATAVPFLEFLVGREEVVGVVSQPDKPSQRGQQLHKTPVKVLAEEKKIPVLQPSKLKDADFLSQLSALKPDAGIVVAYGRIIPAEVFKIFPKGLFNIHFSLLPRLRGAAPIQWAIWRGDKKTGAASFRIVEALDAGNVLVQKSLTISKTDDAVRLEEKLITLGITVLEETLEKIRDGEPEGTSQTGEITYAPIIKKEDARIDWSKPAEDIAAQVRALVRMGAFCRLPDGKNLKILRAEPDSSGANPSPGTLRSIEKGRGFLIECGVGNMLVLRVQVEGKKETDAWSFLQGSRLKVGDKLS